MLIIGSHVSFDKDKQLVKSVMEAVSYGANTFMFYTGAPQNTNRSVINSLRTEEAKKLMEDNNIDYNKVIVHAPYIINLANRKDELKFNFSVSFLKEEINRVEKLGCKYLVLHPGSHVNEGIEVGLKNIIDALNMILNENTKVMVLLETMAGKGSEVGSKIDEIKYIIDNVNHNEKLGICLDTCHLNDSGYDLNEFDKILDEIEEKIGISKIKCIHVNDSKNVIASHKDRHANIGFGEIGYDKLINIIYNKRLEDVPKILETPYIDNLYPPYRYEINMIKNKVFDVNLIDKIKEGK